MPRVPKNKKIETTIAPQADTPESQYSALIEAQTAVIEETPAVEAKPKARGRTAKKRTQGPLAPVEVKEEEVPAAEALEPIKVPAAEVDVLELSQVCKLLQRLLPPGVTVTVSPRSN